MRLRVCACVRLCDVECAGAFFCVCVLAWCVCACMWVLVCVFLCVCVGVCGCGFVGVLLRG